MKTEETNDQPAAGQVMPVVRRAFLFVAIALVAFVASRSKVVTAPTVFAVIQNWDGFDTGIAVDRGRLLFGVWPKGHSQPFGIVVHGYKVWWQPCARGIK